MDRFKNMDNYEKTGGLLGAVWGLSNGLSYVLGPYASSAPVFNTPEQYILILTTSILNLQSIPLLITDFILFQILYPVITYIATVLVSIWQPILEHMTSYPAIDKLAQSLISFLSEVFGLLSIPLIIVLLLIPLALSTSIGVLIGISIARLIRNLKNKIDQ